MDLSELVAYAKEKYHIEERHPWPGYPGLSVLADPKTGKYLALLMREYNFDTGEEIQCCDMKCGRQYLTGSCPDFLGEPFQIRRKDWLGIRMGDSTDSRIVCRLLDQAVSAEVRRHTFGRTVSAEAWRHTIVLDTPSSKHPASPVNSGDKTPHLEIKPSLSSRPSEASNESFSLTWGTAGPTDSFSYNNPNIPEKILEMRRLYNFSSFSFEDKCKNFYRQGKFMENYTDDAPWEGTYLHYFPTYHDLNIPQLRGYFTWRTWVRKGEFRPVAKSFPYIYLYELLCGIGTSSAEDSLNKMKEFESGFLDAGLGDARMQSNLHRWMFEYGVLCGLPVETVRGLADPDTLKQDDALAVLKKPDENSDSAVFDALCVFDGKKLPNSIVIKADEVKGKHLFAALWKKASATCTVNGQKFFAACFDRPRSYVWHPLGNAIHRMGQREEDTDFILDESRSFQCRNGVWKEKRYNPLYFDRTRLQSLLRAGDRLFRKYLKTGHYLKKKPEEEWTEPYIEAVITEDRAETVRPRKPDLSIDFSSLARIREDAAATRDSLLTDEETYGEIPDNIPDIVNAKDTGDITSERESKSTASEASVSESPAPKSPSPQSGSISDSLNPLYVQILQNLLEGKSVNGLIQSHHLMPSVVTDNINEALFDEIGDSVLECDGSNITVIEDYKEDLAELISPPEE